MLYIGESDIPCSDDHEGFVAGRYGDGAYSDIWTDVRRCTERTFVAFAPACECGWRGTDRPSTRDGYDSARQSWVTDHFGQLAGPGRVWRAVDFLTA